MKRFFGLVIALFLSLPFVALQAKEKCFTIADHLEVLKTVEEKHKWVISVYLWESDDGNFAVYAFSDNFDKVGLSFFDKNQCMLIVQGRRIVSVPMNATIERNMESAVELYRTKTGRES